MIGRRWLMANTQASLSQTETTDAGSDHLVDSSVTGSYSPIKRWPYDRFNILHRCHQHLSERKDCDRASDSSLQLLAARFHALLREISPTYGDSSTWQCLTRPYPSTDASGGKMMRWSSPTRPGC